MPYEIASPLTHLVLEKQRTDPQVALLKAHQSPQGTQSFYARIAGLKQIDGATGWIDDETIQRVNVRQR